MVRVTKFSEQKAKGDKLEALVLGIVKRKKPRAYIQLGADKEKDIVIPEDSIKIECSDNPKSKWNVFIEIRKGEGYPSKLATTTAHLWVVGTPAYLYITTPAMLWGSVAKHELGRSLDGNWGYSVKVKELIYICRANRKQ